MTKLEFLATLDKLIDDYAQKARKTGDINLVYAIQDIRTDAETLPDA